jgi:hypothetical protein
VVSMTERPTIVSDLPGLGGLRDDAVDRHAHCQTCHGYGKYQQIVTHRALPPGQFAYAYTIRLERRSVKQSAGAISAAGPAP